MKPIKLALLTCLAACSVQAQWTWESLNQTTTLGNGDIFCVQQIQSGNWTNKWEYTTNVIESLLGLSGIGYALPIVPGANITITTNAAGVTIASSGGGGGGGGSATIQTNSVTLATGVTNFNFVGAGSAAVTGSTTPGSATVTITGSGSGGSGSTNPATQILSYAADGYQTNVYVNFGGLLSGMDPNAVREFRLTLTNNALITITNGYDAAGLYTAKAKLQIFQGTNNNGGWYTYWNIAAAPGITNVYQDISTYIASSVGTNGQAATISLEYYTNYPGWVMNGYVH
jgi:hypothetical protein